MEKHVDHEECAEFDLETDGKMEDYEPIRDVDSCRSFAPYPDSFNDSERF